jgi:hypothetical protein
MNVMMSREFSAHSKAGRVVGFPRMPDERVGVYNRAGLLSRGKGH